ncbi:MAG: type II toxin-antitoxin system VapC family toxin, partial [Myxococcota bacterium]
MILPDVNVLVYAHREDVVRHTEYRDWLGQRINGDEACGVSDQVLSGFLRVVTHPRVFATPTPLGRALEFAEAVRGGAPCVSIAPGDRHWDLFTRLCTDVDARGNLIPDAWFAALAIESGSEW